MADHFDYATSCQEHPEHPERLKLLSKRLRGTIFSTTPLAIRIGDDLNEAKSLIMHGRFGAFCTDVLEIDQRVAQLARRLWAPLAAQPQGASGLPENVFG